MLWDMVQQLQIGEANTRAGDAARDASSARNEIMRLRRQVDALSLACSAMWEVLKQIGDLNDKHLAAMMEHVDLKDGVRDGKITTPPGPCPACQRPNAPQRTHCMYCGGELEANPFA